MTLDELKDLISETTESLKVSEETPPSSEESSRPQNAPLAPYFHDESAIVQSSQKNSVTNASLRKRTIDDTDEDDADDELLQATADNPFLSQDDIAAETKKSDEEKSEDNSMAIVTLSLLGSTMSLFLAWLYYREK